MNKASAVSNGQFKDNKKYVRKPQICKVCSERVMHMTSHMRRRHTKERPFSCTDCPAKFHTTSDKNNHTRAHHSSKREFKCETCEKSFKTKNALRGHFKFVHQRLGQTFCVFCDRRCSSRQNEWLHLLRHVEEKPFDCNICNQSYSSSSELNSHLLRHTQEKLYHCKFCNESFVRLNHLKNHQYRAHGLNTTATRQVPCNACNKVISSAANLKTHIALMHSEEFNFECDVCDQKFRIKAHLTRHRLRHFGEDGKLHCCNLCGKKVYSTTELNRHMSAHTGEKLFKCNICQEPFYTARSLESHERTHSKYRPRTHTCSSCDASFMEVSTLKQHLKIVHSTKRFGCQKCGKSCKGKASLHAHEKQVHCKFEFKLVCPFCLKWFREKSQHFEHLLGHIKEKPSFCKECNASFACPRRRTLHMIHKHSNRT